MPNLKHSPEGLIEAFEHHLVYEVNMLLACFNCLQLPADAFGPVVLNALIESFCIHARNLIDFLEEKSETPGQADRDYVGAKHFTVGYSPSSENRPSNDLRARLNGQIAHLTYDRSAIPERKIRGNERHELMRLIAAELARFEVCLREPYLSRWPFNYAGRGTPNGDHATATNAVQVATLNIEAE